MLPSYDSERLNDAEYWRDRYHDEVALLRSDLRAAEDELRKLRAEADQLRQDLNRADLECRRLRSELTNGRQ